MRYQKKTYKRTITSKELNNVVSSFTVYKFIKALTTPFEKTEAYRKGVIDERGKYLKNPIGQISVLDRLIINIKVLLNMIPDPRVKSQLNYLTTGIGLIAEDSSKYGADPYEVFESLVEYLSTQGIDLDSYIMEETKGKSEVTGHLPHVGELLYTGQGGDAIEHLKATHRRLRGKATEGHNVSYKADGSISVVFGKHKGRPFVQYKTSPTAFYSDKEVDDYVGSTGKKHLAEPFKAALRAASHEKIAHNRSFQADVALRSDSEMRGNLLRYKPPRPTTRGVFAIHSEIDSDTGKKIASNPNLSGLNSDDYEFPHLSLNERKFNLDRKTSKKLGTHIRKAQRIIADKDVGAFLGDVAKHEDPGSKMGARRIHFRRFGQAVQEKKFARNMRGFVAFSKAELVKEKNKKQAARIRSHMEYGMQNRKALARALRAHEHIDRARQIIYDTTTRESMPMSAVEGGMHEGIVSEIAGKGMVKFVPSSFTTANVAQKGKFQKGKKKKTKKVKKMNINEFFKKTIRKKLKENSEVEIEPSEPTEMQDTPASISPEQQRIVGRSSLLKHIKNMAQFNPNLSKVKSAVPRLAKKEEQEEDNAN
jgi:hypothetical protein